MTVKLSVVLATAGTLALTACTDPNSPGGVYQPGPRTQNGAIAGAVLGGLFGATRNGDDKLAKAATGALVGGALGGLIGNELDKQAQEIRSQVDSRIQVVNTGDRLIVTLPEGILFATGSDAVNASVNNDLYAVADTLNRYPNSTVQVIGHTDSVGSAPYNQDLSQRRASAVAAILGSGGVASSRLIAIGRGEDEPVASNLTPEGKQQNRRVEIVIIPGR